MRSSSLLGGLALAALAGLAGVARAQPDATIAAETDVRSGHGDSPLFYPTNHLHVGDRVRIVKEEDGGWLAIVPPSGSFSWIRKDLVKPIDDKQPRALMVDADSADIRVGSALSKDPPLVVGKKVARGTIVTPLPNPLEKADGEGIWVPIYPPDGELRYVRADAVKRPAQVVDRTNVPAAPPAATPAAGQDAESIYRRAIDAEKFNPQDAITLYTQGANADANADRRLQALNRANWLRDNLRNPTQTLVPGPAPGADLRMAAAPSESKVYPLSADPAVRLTAPQGPGVPATTTSAATPGAATPPTPGAANEYSTGVGWLQNAGRVRDGRKTFVMVSERGVPFYYVTAQPGVNLDGYLKHKVECFGEAVYDGELRHNYMRVSRVELREGQ